MRPLALVLFCVASTALAAWSPVFAQVRLPRAAAATRMTCAEAMDLVKREGDVVIAVGPAPERFVRGRNQCDFSEIAELRFVPTKDNPQCPIGYRCREPGFEEWNW